MQRSELEKLVIEWGKDKNLNDPVKQTLKTLSEAGELADAVCKTNELDRADPYSDKMADVIDAIGDIEVCLTILKSQLGLIQNGCLESAWSEVKDRTGKTENGTFVKK